MPEQMRDRTKDQCPLYRELLQVNEKKQTFQLKKLAAQRRNANDHEKGTEKYSGTCRDLSLNSKKTPTTSAWTRLGGRSRCGIPFAVGWCQRVSASLGGVYFGKTHQMLKIFVPLQEVLSGPCPCPSDTTFWWASVDF